MTAALDRKRLAFGRELKRAMEARGVSAAELGRHPDVPVSAGQIKHLRLGKRRPMHSTAAALADVLDWPTLIVRSLALSTYRCQLEGCGKEFVADARCSTVKYCSTACRATDVKRRNREKSADLRKLGDARMKHMQDVIAAFCRGCEPTDLICRDVGGDGSGTCPLRPFSPLPFVPFRKEAA